MKGPTACGRCRIKKVFLSKYILIESDKWACSVDCFSRNSYREEHVNREIKKVICGTPQGSVLGCDYSYYILHDTQDSSEKKFAEFPSVLSRNSTKVRLEISLKLLQIFLESNKISLPSSVGEISPKQNFAPFFISG